jgi:transcriptional regulator with XRE-family HTH domain
MMTITHSEYKKGLPSARQAKIAARAKELIAEEMTLREVRNALEKSQATIAELLGWRQGDLSKFERRTDAYLSTIRRYIEAMGGELNLVASFPNMQPVKIVHIGYLAGSYDEVEEEQEEPVEKLTTITAKR